LADAGISGTTGADSRSRTSIVSIRKRSGPLSGMKLVEIAGIGPAPPVLAPLADLGMANDPT